MKGFPKYFNSRSDYLNLLRDWPPAYAGRRKQLLAAVARLESTAVIDCPVWPEGYDPNDPGADPVAPIGTESVPDANGEIYRLGFDLKKTEAIKYLVGILDPSIETAEKWQSLVDDGQYHAISGECADLAVNLAGLGLDEQLTAVEDGLGKILEDQGEAVYQAIDSVVIDLFSARERVLAEI